jgi:hypothetical protein
MTVRTSSLVALASLIGGAAQAQSLSGYRYSLHLQSDSKDQHIASVRDAGDRARYDFAASDDYLLILDGGKRVITVHTADQDYNEVADTSLERVIGQALRAVSKTGLVEFNVKQLDIRTRLVGPGGMVAGRETRHYRLTQDFTVAIRALGEESDNIHQVVVTDYWVDPTLRLVRNPFLELLASAETALAQHSENFRERSATARAALFKGVPLRVVVTSLDVERETNEKKSLVVEVERLAKTTFDRADFEIPAGYRRRPGDFKLNLGGGFCCL